MLCTKCCAPLPIAALSNVEEGCRSEEQLAFVRDDGERWAVHRNRREKWINVSGIGGLLLSLSPVETEMKMLAERLSSEMAWQHPCVVIRAFVDET